MSLYEAIMMFMAGAVSGMLAVLFSHHGEMFEHWIEQLERESEDEE